MAYSNTIGILIAAKDEASAVIAKTAETTKAATAEVNNFGNASSATGSMLKTGLAVGIVAVVAESTNLAIKFQQDIEVLHTNAGVAASSLDGLSKSFLDMAGSVGQTPDDLAKAFYHIASAGTGIWSTAQQLDVLKAAAEGAAIGQASLDETTYSLTSAMSSGIGGVKNAAEMMAVLNAVVGAGDMKLGDLNAALGTGILSTAQAFGISIQSVGTAIATLTDNGEHADEAATRLRMTFALMASPSSVAAKQLSALGLTAEDASNATAGMNKVFAESGLTTTKLADDLRQPNGITTAMKDLKTHLEAAGLSSSETDAMLSKAFGGGRTDAALLTMLGNLDRMDAKFSSINTNASNFSQNLADQQQTDAQKVKDAWSSIQSDLTKLGSATAPLAAGAITDIANAVSGLFNWYGQLSPVQKTLFDDLGVGILALTGAVVAIKTISFGIGSAVDAFTALSNAGKWAKAAADTVGVWGKAATDIGKGWADSFGSVVRTGADTAGGLAKNAVSTGKAWGKAATGAVSDFADMAKGGVLSAAKATGAWIVQLPKMLAQMSITAIKASLYAADVALAWTINAVRVSFVWVTTELPKLIVGFVTTSASAAKEGAATAAEWVASAVKTSVAWVTTELPKIVAGFVTTTAKATVEGTKTAAAWVASAVKTSVAWVTTELPKLAIGFVETSKKAVIEAVATSATWVASAAKTSFVWVTTELPKIVAGFVATTASAVTQGIATSAAWTESAVTSSKSYQAFQLLVTTPMVMPAIAIGAALFAISQVVDAYNNMKTAVEGAKGAVDKALSDTEALKKRNAEIQAGPYSADVKAKMNSAVTNAIKADSSLQSDLSKDNLIGWWNSLSITGIPGFASGGFTGSGGINDAAGIVHKGEYVIPQSGVNQSTGTPKSMGGVSVTGGVHIYNNMDAQRFLASLGWKLALS